eukprot:TRINITY_DN11716_c0_g2_i1.p1 TRINITY_DN11716_c0_g2~~TRINITY_DN11716_c0_g2_i1.p1  ORF type:complete len:335 (-),score=112.37 TRINITY_DN11716_c0_g2_i1:49-1053(-)
MKHASWKVVVGGVAAGTVAVVLLVLHFVNSRKRNEGGDHPKSEEQAKGSLKLTQSMGIEFDEKKKIEIQDDQLQFLKQYTQNNDVEYLKNHVIRVVEEIRESKLHVFGCVWSLKFLTPSISLVEHAKCYDEILQNAEHCKIAEIGCGFGQDVRKLIYDGVKPQNITAIDIHDGYWKLGKRLFMDEQVMDNHVRKLFGDLGKLPSEGGIDLEKEGLLESYDFVCALKVLHVLSEKQVEVMLANVLKMMRNKAKFFGVAAGKRDIPGAPGFLTPSGEEKRYWHTGASLAALLRQVGFVYVEIVQTELEPPSSKVNIQADLSNFIMLYFSAEKHHKE